MKSILFHFIGLPTVPKSFPDYFVHFWFRFIQVGVIIVICLHMMIDFFATKIQRLEENNINRRFCFVSWCLGGNRFWPIGVRSRHVKFVRAAIF